MVTVSLYFRWDKSVHDEEYITNNGALNRFISAVERIDPEKISSIEATAYSSPEGVYEHNMKLSRERANYVKNILYNRLPDLKGLIRVRAGGEAWALLRERVVADKKLTNWWRTRILSFLDDDSISNDTRKWRLINRLGYEPTIGDMYKYLLHEHYPYLRNCMVVVITLKDEGDAAAVQGEFLPVVPESKDSAATAGDNSVTPADSTAKSGETAESAETAESGNSGDSAEPADSLVPEETSAAQERGRKPVREFRPVLGLSTNIPYDITFIPGYGLTSIPSFSVEYYPSNWGHWTFGADIEWPMWKHWDTHRFMQINNGTVWARRYFREAEDRYKGLYLSGSANTARFGVGFNDKGWKGEGGGLSVGIGHKWMLGQSRFYIDAGLAAGFFYAAYDSYTYGNDALGWYYFDYSGKAEDFKARSRRWLWLGPTRIYVSFGIDLFNRNRK